MPLLPPVMSTIFPSSLPMDPPRCVPHDIDAVGEVVGTRGLGRGRLEGGKGRIKPGRGKGCRAQTLSHGATGTWSGVRRRHTCLTPRLWNWGGGFAGWVEEWRGEDFRRDGVADGFYGHFDLQRGSGSGRFARDAGQGDHFFQRGGPGGAGSFADVLAVAVDRDSSAAGHAGNLRSHVHLV